MFITASIVTYKNRESDLIGVIDSVLNSNLIDHLYIIDNSPNDYIKKYCDSIKITYMFNNSNVGFGAGHNIVLRKKDLLGKYHIVINPDIVFKPEAINEIAEFMESNSEIGNIMPKVLYPNGDLQYLCKLLPTPWIWILRFIMPKSISESLNYKFEMRFSDYNKVMDVPYLSGCFMFLRTSCIEDIGVFDENIFMYGEDADLNRRIHSKYRTVYFPNTEVIHNFEKGSHKNLRLFIIHLKAYIYYFHKWGWLFDKERRTINNRILKSYE